jgi:hypothetical protein
MKRRKWQLPRKITPSPYVQRRDVLERLVAEDPQGIRKVLGFLRQERDIYRHNARECEAAVRAIEAVLGEVEA